MAWSQSADRCRCFNFAAWKNGNGNTDIVSGTIPCHPSKMFNATITNGSTATDGYISSSGLFKSTTGTYLAISSNDLFFNSTKPFTYQTLVKINVGPTRNGHIPTFATFGDSYSSATSVAIFLGDGTSNFKGINIALNGGTQRKIGRSTVSALTGRYHHIAITYDGTQIGNSASWNFYIDGRSRRKSIYSGARSPRNNLTRFFVWTTTSNFLNADTYYINCYRDVLRLSSITANYNRGNDLGLSGYNQPLMNNSIIFKTGSNRYWIGGATRGTTDWNNTLNWSNISGGPSLTSGGIPTYNDDVIFDQGGSGYNCKLSAQSYCNSLIRYSGWNSKDFDDGGYNLHSNNGLYYNYQGTLTLSGTQIIQKNGDFFIKTTGLTPSLYDANLDMKGTGRIEYNFNHSNASVKTTKFYNITCRYNKKITSNYSSNGLYFWNSFSANINGGYDDGYFYPRFRIFFAGSGSVTPYVFNQRQISIIASYIFYFVPCGDSTINIPKTRVHCNIICQDCTGKTITYNMSGNILCRYINFVSQNNSNGTLIFNTNDYTIDQFVATSNFSVTQTGGTNTSNFTLNFGNSIIYIRGNGITFSNDIGSVCNVNLGTSIWYVRIGWIYTPQCVVDPGTSLINFTKVNTTGGANPLITSAGKSFYDIKFNLTSNSLSVSILDDLICNTLQHQLGTNGNFIAVGRNITSNSTIQFNSTGTLNLSNSNITILGDGDFYLDSGVGATTASTCNLDIRGTGSFALNKNSTYFNNITYAYSGQTVTVDNTQIRGNIAGWGNMLTINGGNLSLKGVMGFIGTSRVVNTLTINPGSNITCNLATNRGFYYYPNQTTTAIWNIPRITIGGTSVGIFNIHQRTNYDCIWNLNGDFNVSNLTFNLVNTSVNSQLIFYTNNNSISRNNFIPGRGSARAGFSRFFGTSNINIRSLSNTFGNTSSFYMQDSVWNVGYSAAGTYNWTWDSDWYQQPQNSIINFINNNAVSITPSTRYHGKIICNKSRRVRCTLRGNLRCKSFSSVGNGSFTNSSLYSITADNNVYIRSTGRLTLTNANITITGDGQYYIGSVGTVAGNPNLYFMGNGVISLNKASYTFEKLKTRYGNKSVTSSGLTYYPNVLELGQQGYTSYFIQNNSLIIGSRTASQLLTINGSVIWSGNADRSFSPTLNSVSRRYSISGINYIGTGRTNFQGVGTFDTTYNFMSNCNFGGQLHFYKNGGAGNFIVNTNGYTLSAFGIFQIGRYARTSPSIFTFNSSSSNIYCNGNVVAYDNSGRSTNLNFQSSKWYFNGANITFGTTWVIDPGTSTAYITNTTNLTCYSRNFATLVMNAPTKTITWIDGDTTINRLVIKPNTTSKFKHDKLYTVSTYTSGDWDGTRGNLTKFESTSSGVQWYLNAPRGISTNYLNIKDSDASYGQNIKSYLINGNINSGNNINWTFIYGAIMKGIPINILLNSNGAI